MFQLERSLYTVHLYQIWCRSDQYCQSYKP